LWGGRNTEEQKKKNGGNRNKKRKKPKEDLAQTTGWLAALAREKQLKKKTNKPVQKAGDGKSSKKEHAQVENAPQPPTLPQKSTRDDRPRRKNCGNTTRNFRGIPVKKGGVTKKKEKFRSFRGRGGKTISTG